MKAEKEKVLSMFKKLILFSGLFNIIFAAPLILPFTFRRYLDLLSFLNSVLNFGGVPVSAVNDGIHALLINTAGIDLALIGSIVLYAYFDPENRIGILLLNAIGRTLFFFVIIYYCFEYDIARITLAFGVLDLFISSGFVFFYFRLRTKGVISEIVN